MYETLREKRLKPRLQGTYSFLCVPCDAIEEAPVNLRCSICGADMYSVSALYKRERKHVKVQVAKVKKATPERATQAYRGENILAFLTDIRNV